MKISNSLKICTLLGFVGLVGCIGGSTDGGDAKDPGFDADVFVSGDSTTGTIELVPNETELGIGETTGFHVYVKNADGQPVANMQVACDTEKGLAILEPQKGFELTDDTGQMSGRVGCEAPGSLQMVCRMTIGANRRHFVGFKCRGDVPAGFQGFPGAAGGGLGGGVFVDNPGEVRITGVGFVDDGSFATDVSNDASIDVVQTADCDTTNTNPNEPEPFFDTYAQFSVTNDSNQTVRFSYVTYAVNDADSSGSRYTSSRISLVNENQSTIAGGGDSTVILVPVFKAFGGSKYFGNPTHGTRISSRLGFRSVEFTLVGETLAGDPISVSGSTTASFSNFDRCS